MSSSPDPEIPPPDRDAASSEEKPGTSRLGGLRLLAALCAVVVVAWSTYLVIAPSPEQLPPRANGRIVPDAGLPDPDTVRVLNWTDYISPDTLSDFTAQTGLNVSYTTYQTDAEPLGPLQSKTAQYDLVILSAEHLPDLIDRGDIRPLDTAVISTFPNLDPALMSRLTRYDAGTIYGLIYLWGTTGLAMDREKIARRLGEEAPTRSWGILFDPEKAASLADCGIGVVDSAAAAFRAALMYLGLNPNSERTEDYDAAFRAWEAIQPYVRSQPATELIDSLAAGRICLALTYSGDVFQAEERAIQPIEFVLPDQGAPVWFDLMTVPANAPFPENAYRLIEFLLQPEIAARNTNTVGYANAVPDSRAWLDPALLADSAIYPNVDQFAGLVPEAPLPPSVQGLRERFWALIKTAGSQNSETP